MEKLNFDQATNEDLFTIQVEDKEIYHMIKSGFIDQINKNLNILIDDFEDEEIIGNNRLEEIKRLSHLFFIKYQDHNIYRKIYISSVIAINKGTGLFFFF